MLESLNRIAGPGYAPALLWTFAALIVLVIVLIIIRLIRGMTFGTFIAGGRNRKARLAVMDATAIDTHRRLVLVRRDDVEHLILIGGATDLVVERDIKLIQARRPNPAGESAQGLQPLPPSAPRRPQPHAPAPQTQRAPASPKETPVAPTVHHTPAPASVKPEPYKPLQSDAIDDTLMSELEVSLDALSELEPMAPAKASPSVDDEMARLLGELSSHKKQT